MNVLVLHQLVIQILTVVTYGFLVTVSNANALRDTSAAVSDSLCHGESPNSNSMGAIMCEKCAMLVEPVTIEMCCMSQDVYNKCTDYLSEINAIGGRPDPDAAIEQVNGNIPPNPPHYSYNDQILEKRGDLSNMFNRVWWKAPRKRPQQKVFSNFNRIWWKSGK